MGKHVLPDITFVEARHVGSSQKPTAIVLKLSSTTSDKGAALGIAQNLHRQNAPHESYHYIVDNEMTYQGVPVNVASYANPHRAISVLLCAQPHEAEPLWEDGSARKVMYRTAKLVADLVLTYKIRPRYLSIEAEERWRKHRWRRRGGIILHVQGAWPKEAFLLDVRTQIAIREMRDNRR
jgi:hypothetical protein